MVKEDREYYSKMVKEIKTDFFHKFNLERGGVMVLSSSSEKLLKKFERKLELDETNANREENTKLLEHSFLIKFNGKNGVSNIFVTTNDNGEMDKEFHNIIRNNSLSCLGEKTVEHITIGGKIYRISQPESSFSGEEKI